MPESVNHATDPAARWQQRRGGLQVYFCCCPFALLLAPFLIVARLAHYGASLLRGRPVASPWASGTAPPPVTPGRAA